jgi:uncharacterized membrane protein
MDIIITIFSVIFILFAPGFAISLIFFRQSRIDLIERIPLSFILSIAILPILIFYTNFLGIPINFITVILQVIGIILVAFLIIETQNILKSKKR